MIEMQKRGGWQAEETERLRQEIQHAAESREPLRSVFERMGQEFSRKPNSVRNYYYIQLRGQNRETMRRAAPFETFTPEEVHHLVREVLIARGRGESVRACVMRMAQGDHSRMLRLQNKYRSVLSKKPALICEIADELASEGYACPEIKPILPASPVPLTVPQETDRDAQQLYCAVQNLLRRAHESDPRGDRAKVQRDVCLMRLEEMQMAAGDLIRLCKEVCADELAAAPCDQRREQLILYLSRLENLCANPLC